MIRTSSILASLEGADACCDFLVKAHDAEVLPSVTLVTPVVRAAWESAIRDAVTNLFGQLQEFEEGVDTDLAVLDDAADEQERQAVMDEFIAALILSLATRARAAVPAIEATVLRREARRLLEAGASSVGAPLDFTQRRTQRLLEAAVRDLEFWQGERIRDRADDLGELLEEYFTDPAARGAVRTSAHSGRTHKAWPDRLISKVDDASGATADLITDTWAYRWNRIGQVRGLELAGVRVAYAKATLDAKTTPFCRWVDGKPVAVSKLTRQVNRYVKAVTDGDYDAAREAWPMLQFKAGDGAKQFRKAFKGVGVPPYHFRCRTRLTSRRGE